MATSMIRSMVTTTISMWASTATTLIVAVGVVVTAVGPSWWARTRRGRAPARASTVVSIFSSTTIVTVWTVSAASFVFAFFGTLSFKFFSTTFYSSKFIKLFFLVFFRTKRSIWCIVLVIRFLHINQLTRYPLLSSLTSTSLPIDYHLIR